MADITCQYGKKYPCYDCQDPCAEEQKRREFYDPDPASDEEEELCDYTGEECCSDKRFCEECDVLTEKEE